MCQLRAQLGQVLFLFVDCLRVTLSVMDLVQSCGWEGGRVDRGRDRVRARGSGRGEVRDSRVRAGLMTNHES